MFPGAFSIISPDPDLPNYGLVTHSDGAGSKPVQAYLHYKETNKIESFSGLAQDIIAMNLDDIICVGAYPINLVDYIAINPFKIPKESFIEVLATEFKYCLEKLENLGIKILFSGGETADQPDQIRTLDISGTINGRVNLNHVITGKEIKEGNAIIGLRSGGRTRYENKDNSGIMCNGLTLARLCLIDKNYQLKYPEIADSKIGRYYGNFKFDDYSDELGMRVGEALISPTRLFAPAVMKIMKKHGPNIMGLVHNTAGGQTKSLRIGNNIHFDIGNPQEPDPIFHLIKTESRENWRSMYMNFNMGTGFTIIADNEVSEDILAISDSFGLKAKIIGECLNSNGKNRMTIKSSLGRFRYEAV
jgi:phosphoribosylformylglycinamidine cyclo-ligase